MGESSVSYRRRRPEETLLYRVVKNHYETFVAHLEQEGESLPGYVESAFEAFLDCGMLPKGFARFYCNDCSHSRLVAFS